MPLQESRVAHEARSTPALLVRWDKHSAGAGASCVADRLDALRATLQKREASFYHGSVMPFPIKVCAVCGEEFELKPGKPGFANRCPACSEPEEADAAGSGLSSNDTELNAARRNAMRDMLYRKES